MRYTPVTIHHKRFRIVPSLENMCNLEAATGVNLISGVNPLKVDLRFLKATLENIIEDEQGNHIDSDTLEWLYQSDVGEAQKIFLACYRQMYTLPKPDKKAIKKVLGRNKTSEKSATNGSVPATLPTPESSGK